jgi:hypothetical protein
LYDINHSTKIRVNLIKVSAMPILSTAIMAVAVWISFRMLNPIAGRSLAALMAIAFAVLVYAVSLFITGAITKEDLEFIPKGEKLKKFVRK